MSSRSSCCVIPGRGARRCSIVHAHACNYVWSSRLRVHVHCHVLQKLAVAWVLCRAETMHARRWAAGCFVIAAGVLRTAEHTIYRSRGACSLRLWRAACFQALHLEVHCRRMSAQTVHGWNQCYISGYRTSLCICGTRVDTSAGYLLPSLAEADHDLILGILNCTCLR